MKTFWRRFNFWFWPAFLVSIFTILNVAGFPVKGSRFFGFPYSFAVWRPGYAIEWGFESYALLLDVVIGLTIFFLAWGFTAWRFR